MTRAEWEILDRTYGTAHNLAAVLRNMVRKTQNEDLAVDLNRQLGQYQDFIQKAGRKMKRAGVRPQKEDLRQQAAKWLHLQSSTMLNTSTPHIAGMVIEEQTKDMKALARTLYNSRQKENQYCEFASELIDFTEHSIEQLKYYLNV